MQKYLYIVIDKNKEDKHLSYHRTQESAYYTVARLSNIPFTRKNFNVIGNKGGWKSEYGNYFVLEKDLEEKVFPFEE